MFSVVRNLFISVFIFLLIATTATLAQDKSYDSNQLAGEARAHFRSPPEILWLKDIQHAKQLALQSDRPLFIHFMQDGCLACDYAAKRTFKDPQLIEILHSQFIPVKINIKQHPDLRKQFHIKQTPTDIILDTYNNEVFRRKTDFDPRSYHSILASATAATNQKLDISVGVAFNPMETVSPISPSTGALVTRASYPPGGYPAGSPTQAQISNQQAFDSTTRTVHGPEPKRSKQPFPPPSELQAPQIVIPGQNDPVMLGLDGYCPVALADLHGNGAAWIKGDPYVGIKHRDRLYLFTGQSQRQLFLTNPDKFSPVLSGFDAVLFADHRRLINGQRRFGVSYKQRIYLFQNENSLPAFWRAPDRYAHVALQAMARTR